MSLKSLLAVDQTIIGQLPLQPLMTKCIATVLFILHCFTGACQDGDSLAESRLQEVVIRSYELNRKMKDVPAAINYLNQNALDRFSTTPLVQAINTTPGIRMEERSPGSYRINIRGSSLRSPFGVRNVKVYFNDVPITYPGGYTYLNQLGTYNFNSLEIIKGPGSSLYGAGTGGVMLIQSLQQNASPAVVGEVTTGSYGLQNYYAGVTTGAINSSNRIGLQHQSSSGYRDHAQLQRTTFAWTGHHRLSENTGVRTTMFFGDLFYQTPGALTSSEFNANPRAARPAVGAVAGAEQMKASVTQKQFVAGVSFDHSIASQWKNTTTLFGMSTDLRNPTIQNYAHSTEPQFGGRTSFQFKHAIREGTLLLDAGAEWQRSSTALTVHKNVNGNADSLRYTDDSNSQQALTFLQASADYKSWLLTTGASINLLRVEFERFTPAALGKQKREFNNVITPRVALLKRFRQLNAYASISKGFSPPTTAELLPSGGAVNLELNAETGVNYDVGIKSSFSNGLYIDINAFSFALNNTIVQRRTAAGGDYFINAGSTRQRGVETYISYLLPSALSKTSTVWLSHTFHDFRYMHFRQLTVDYSGNHMPGVPPHVLSTGADIQLRNGILAMLSYYYNDRIALNDANSAYASPFHVVAAKMGYQKWLNTVRFKIIAGVDNLLDQRYSLGNDINGFGGRYYNAAAGRNYYTSLIVDFRR